MGLLSKAEALREISEELDLRGLYFQHAALCRRRAWLHLAGATVRSSFTPTLAGSRFP